MKQLRKNLLKAFTANTRIHADAEDAADTDTTAAAVMTAVADAETTAVAVKTGIADATKIGYRRNVAVAIFCVSRPARFL